MATETPTDTAPDAAQPATVDGCQVIARIDGQVVLACEVLWRVNQMLEENRDRIPPQQYEAIRDQLMQRTLAGMIDQKLLYGEFRRNIPPENMPRIEKNLVGPFEEREVPRLMKQLDVKSQRELEQELSRLGSSMDDARQSFNEHVIASEWIRTKIKVSEEVSPEEMVEYYRDHRNEFEFPTQARWEELMVHKGATPANGQQAFAKLAMMGNDVWPRMSANPSPATPIFADVAKARSEGLFAAKGGFHDWTTKGALKAGVLDEAIFSLPVGQMSLILDSGPAFHIVRVLRAQRGRLPAIQRGPERHPRQAQRTADGGSPAEIHRQAPQRRQALDRLHRQRLGGNADGQSRRRHADEVTVSIGFSWNFAPCILRP